MAIGDLKENLGGLWEQLTEGFRHLWRTAAGALTRFRPGSSTNLPAESEVDDTAFLPSRGWAMLSGDVFEDDQRIVVRVELPGLEKDQIRVEVEDDLLTISGEKRFQRESAQGRWRLIQCAYGSFERRVPLPAAVNSDEARASYKNGVLRVELPKRVPGRPAGTVVRVE